MLGEWNPEQCIFLDTDATTFPYWIVSLNLPRDKKIEYKYVIIHQQHVIRFDNPVNQFPQGLPITQMAPPSVVQVQWEDLGHGKNRKLSTYDKS
jgi:hypothetical protein